MAWAVSDRFRDALGTAHEPISYADLYFGGVLLHERMPIAGGSITVREDSKVRRSISLPVGFQGLTIPETYRKLSPFGAEIRVYSGVKLGAGYAETVPVGVFVIEDAGQSGHFSSPLVQAGDRAVSIQADRFLQPHNTAGERTVPQEIANLLLATIPELEVYDLSFSKASTPTATWDRDRWDCCEALAASVGAEVYFDPEGRAIIRPVPEVRTVTNDDGSELMNALSGALYATSDWELRGGPGGTLSDYSVGVSRDQVYNGVVVTGETQDVNTAPATAFVYQKSGPLRWGGPFRKVARFYSSPVIRTTEGAIAAGEKVLARSVAFSAELLVDAVPNAAMDVGDQVDVVLPDGALEPRVVREITLPLGLDGLMRVGTRVGTDVGATTTLGEMS